MIRTVSDMDVAGKRLVVRADLNVPMAEGEVSDATRITRFAAFNAAAVADDFTYVSSAGGAFLEWLEGRTLPGVAALHQAEKV